MKTVGIAIDPWKLKSFKKGLDDAGYKYTVHGKETDSLMCIKVDCHEAEVMTMLFPLIQSLDKNLKPHIKIN